MENEAIKIIDGDQISGTPAEHIIRFEIESGLRVKETRRRIC